jgi:hypothetical protein
MFGILVITAVTRGFTASPLPVDGVLPVFDKLASKIKHFFNWAIGDLNVIDPTPRTLFAHKMLS